MWNDPDEIDEVLEKLMARLAGMDAPRAHGLHDQLRAAHAERQALALELARAHEDMEEVADAIRDLNGCFERTLARATRFVQRHRPEHSATALTEVCDALHGISELRDVALGYVAVLEHLDEARGALELDARFIEPELAACEERWATHNNRFEAVVREAGSLARVAVNFGALRDAVKRAFPCGGKSAPADRETEIENSHRRDALADNDCIDLPGKTLQQIVTEAKVKAIARNGGNLVRAHAELGVSRSTMTRFRGRQRQSS